MSKEEVPGTQTEGGKPDPEVHSETDNPKDRPPPFEPDLELITYLEKGRGPKPAKDPERKSHRFRRAVS